MKKVAAAAFLAGILTANIALAEPAADILKQALSAGGKNDPASLRERIVRMKEFEGLQGKIVFDAHGKAQRGMFVFSIENGTFRRIDR